MHRRGNKKSGMKHLIRKYRVIPIWLSLMIISLAFTIGSDRASREVCVPAAFFAGMLLYLLGGIKEWTRDKTTIAMVELFLSVCMLAGAVLSLLRQGGLL